MPARGGAQLLLGLPEPLLEAILLQFTTAERARTFPLVCRQLRDLCRRSPHLWAVLRIDERPLGTPATARSWCRWLLPRAANVRSLQLTSPRLPQAQLAPIWAVACTALAALSPTLVQLHLAWAGPLVVEGWLGGMQALELAILSGRSVELRASLAALPRLRSLHCGAPLGRLAFAGEGPCLPPCLSELTLLADSIQSLPPGLSTLTALVSLQVRQSYLVELAGLAPALGCLTALEELRLSRCLLSDLPIQLSALARLRVLYLEYSFLRGVEPPGEEQWAAALGPLARLAVLSLSGSRLGTLPRAVVAMTTLKCLLLHGSFRLDLSSGPYLQGLQELSLSRGTLFRSHAVLPAATQLSKLYICGSGRGRPHGGGQGNVVMAQWGPPQIQLVAANAIPAGADVGAGMMVPAGAALGGGVAPLPPPGEAAAQGPQHQPQQGGVEAAGAAPAGEAAAPAEAVAVPAGQQADAAAPGAAPAAEGEAEQPADEAAGLPAEVPEQQEQPGEEQQAGGGAQPQGMALVEQALGGLAQHVAEVVAAGPEAAAVGPAPAFDQAAAQLMQAPLEQMQLALEPLGQMVEQLLGAVAGQAQHLMQNVGQALEQVQGLQAQLQAGLAGAGGGAGPGGNLLDEVAIQLLDSDGDEDIEDEEDIPELIDAEEEDLVLPGWVVGNEDADWKAADVAASLAALPALRALGDVYPGGHAVQLPPGAAELMYLLPRACPELALHVLRSDGFGWGRAEVAAAEAAAAGGAAGSMCALALAAGDRPRG